MVRDAAEGEEVFRRLSRLLERFLSVSLDYLGAVVSDVSVGRSVREGVPVLIAEPRSMASQCIAKIAARLSDDPRSEPGSGGIRLFWKSLLSLREAS